MSGGPESTSVRSLGQRQLAVERAREVSSSEHRGKRRCLRSRSEALGSELEGPRADGL